jgi:hypothetical protein
LRAEANREPAAQFHSLYDKIHSMDVLLHAWRCCRANGSAPGVDRMTFEQIETRGVARSAGRNVSPSGAWINPACGIEVPTLESECMRPVKRKPDARNGHVRFEERGMETECTVGYSGADNRKGRSPPRPRLNITAPLLGSTNR